MGNKRELLKRVREMEARYDELARILDELDEAGLIPPGVKRGVLSEDGLYDLLLEAEKAKR